MPQLHRKTAEKHNQREYTEGAFKRAQAIRPKELGALTWVKGALKLDAMTTEQLKAVEFLLDLLA